MPMKSKAQNRLMHAAAAGKSSKVPKRVGQKFVAHSRGKPQSRLPERKAGRKR